MQELQIDSWAGKFCPQVVARPHDADKPLGCRVNPSELMEGHSDELVSLARQRGNRDRMFWLPDPNSEDLCDSGDFPGVRVNVRIRGGCYTSLVPVNKATMKNWLKTTFVRHRNTDTEPPGPWVMTEHMDNVRRGAPNDYSWVDQITFSYPPSNAGGAKVLQVLQRVLVDFVLGHPQHHQSRLGCASDLKRFCCQKGHF